MSLMQQLWLAYWTPRTNHVMQEALSKQKKTPGLVFTRTMDGKKSLPRVHVARTELGWSNTAVGEHVAKKPAIVAHQETHKPVACK
jgi:hypothetical protein